MAKSTGILVRVITSKITRKFADILISPLTLLSALWFRYIRSRYVNEMPVSKKIFERIGVFPIADHYFEPLFNTSKHLKKPLDEDRNLPGINLNKTEQLQLLEQFNYNDELKRFPLVTVKELTYYYRNSSFPSGDSELLYNIIRLYKPSQLIEIGCGFSTLMIQNALRQNLEEGYQCKHICVEPYEMEWLERLGIKIVRKKVEDLDLNLFRSLKQNDILFIDSSHMIRPQGDVLFEYLEILPILNKGVLVHIHDIFSPKDYPSFWVRDINRFWNEQYLLEAFLTENLHYKILLAANYLRHHHELALLSKCPILAEEPVREPGSFWIQRIDLVK